MINDIIDYELSYSLFLAECELYNDMIHQGVNVILSESKESELLVIQEGVKDTIMKYIQKVALQIQKVWTKFKAGFVGKVSNFLDKTVKPSLDKMGEVKFTANNFKELDINNFNNIQVKPWQYSDDNKANFESMKAYIDSTYPNVPDGDIAKYVEDQCLNTTNKEFDKKEVLNLYTFCTRDYKNLVDRISADIEAFNSASKNITTNLNTVTAPNEAYIFCNETYLGIISEEGEEKTTFTDSSGETTGGTSSESAKNNNALTKAVTVYMGVSTKILSAKMKVLNKYFNDSCIFVLKHVVESKKKNPSAVEASSNTPTTAPQVET